MKILCKGYSIRELNKQTKFKIMAGVIYVHQDPWAKQESPLTYAQNNRVD